MHTNLTMVDGLSVSFENQQLFSMALQALPHWQHGIELGSLETNQPASLLNEQMNVHTDTHMHVHTHTHTHTHMPESGIWSLCVLTEPEAFLHCTLGFTIPTAWDRVGPSGDASPSDAAK